eukprot:1314405-Amphidinium_carterae.1
MSSRYKGPTVEKCTLRPNPKGTKVVLQRKGLGPWYLVITVHVFMQIVHSVMQVKATALNAT